MALRGLRGHSRGMGSGHCLRVFLADDSHAICERVAAMLAGPDVAIVGEASTPSACVAGILAAHPDVVVLDVQLFSNNSGPAYRKRYLGAGAVGFLDKSAEFDQLAHAVSRASMATH
jgi:DNA-binding NarL/FixJ family response regulator